MFKDLFPVLEGNNRLVEIKSRHEHVSGNNNAIF